MSEIPPTPFLPSDVDRATIGSPTFRLGLKAGSVPLQVHQDSTSCSQTTRAIASAVSLGFEKSVPEVRSYTAFVPSTDSFRAARMLASKASSAEPSALGQSSEVSRMDSLFQNSGGVPHASRS